MKWLGVWSPARWRCAVWAVLTAAATGTLAFVLDPSGQVLGPALYVVVATGAILVPAGVAAQVMGGQLLLGSLLVGQGGPDPLLLLPSVAGVVATAELLAVVARLDTPLARGAPDAFGRAGLAAAVGVGAFAAVVLAGDLPGPTGLLAVVLASGAVAAVAARMVGD